jgi:hypothetical protein
LTGRSSELSQKADLSKVIREIQPSLSKAEAQKLTQAFAKIAADKSCSVSWSILLSIAFTESSLKKGSIGRMNPKTLDYGLMQINERTLASLKLNKKRLMTDELYSLQAGCKILSANKARFEKAFPQWIGLYRSGTAVKKSKIRKTAREYDSIIRSRAASYSRSLYAQYALE